jgi:hypothetical protein
MECYACEQAATMHCSRCGKGYCPAHGGELCGDCLNPLNAAPSNVVFRTSLFTLLIASVLAIWLLVRPPDLPSEAGSAIRPQPTALGSTPGATKPPGFPTPVPEVTPTAAAETPASDRTEYTVVENDTWYGIADAFGVDAENLAAVNGLTLDDFIIPGDVLIIPE